MMPFRKPPPPPPPPTNPPPKTPKKVPRDTLQEYPPGPKVAGTWYMYYETSKIDENNQFHNIFIVFQREGSNGRGAFAMVSLDTPNFAAAWDIQVKRAREAIDMLNNINPEEVEEETSVCATCGESFVGEDYLCDKCREPIPQ